MNEYSSTIFYDLRMCISAPIKTPITWKCSKVENMNPRGINTLTFAQDRWNEHVDVFDYGNCDFSSVYDPDKVVHGIYADYGETIIKPAPEPPIIDMHKDRLHGEITWSSKLQVKVGGSFKKLTINFYDENNEKIDIENIGDWNFEIDKVDASQLIEEKLEGNVLWIKFLGDDSYIGKVLNVTNKTDNILTSVAVEIVGL